VKETADAYVRRPQGRGQRKPKKNGRPGMLKRDEAEEAKEAGGKFTPENPEARWGESMPENRDRKRIEKRDSGSNSGERTYEKLRSLQNPPPESIFCPNWRVNAMRNMGGETRGSF